MVYRAVSTHLIPCGQKTHQFKDVNTLAAIPLLLPADPSLGNSRATPVCRRISSLGNTNISWLTLAELLVFEVDVDRGVIGEIRPTGVNEFVRDAPQHGRQPDVGATAEEDAVDVVWEITGASVTLSSPVEFTAEAVLSL